MATHDYIISNASGASVRADLNNALAAIVSNNSNATSPATTYAFQFWADTTTGQLKIRNAANSAWITLMELDGTMLMEDGSASTPGLAFADDTNTGIFSGAADQIGFATGGAERLRLSDGEAVFNDPSNDVDFRVESNGNSHMLFVDAGNDRVGIGTSAPGDTFEVKAGFPVIAMVDSDTTNDKFRIVHNGGSTQLQVDPNNVSSSSHLLVSVDGSEKARIDSSGRLLIAATSSDAHADADDLQVGAATDSGERGITVASSAAGSIRFADNGNDTAGYIFYDHADNSLRFGANGSERARIDSSGMVGIGTTSPSAHLHVNSGSTDTPAIFDSTNASGAHVRFFQNGSAKHFLGCGGGFSLGDVNDLALRGFDNILFATGDSSTERMRIDSSGNLLVGTTTAAGNMTVNMGTDKNISFNGNQTEVGSVPAFVATNNAGSSLASMGFRATDLRFATGSSERMRIDSSGNVGIGTSSPGFKLDVNGSANFGQITVNDVVASSTDDTFPVFRGLNAAGTATNFRVNGDGSAFFLSDVGIGTSSPDRTLSVSDTSGGLLARFLGPTNNLFIDNDRSGIIDIFSTGSGDDLAFGTEDTERMRILSGGGIVFGRTSQDNTALGFGFHNPTSTAASFNCTNTSNAGGSRVVLINRQNSDGTLIDFRQANTSEGAISVSGSTVSLIGGHLSRWSQTLTLAEHTDLLRGTVLTNLDEMCEWTHDAQDAVLYTEEDELPEGVSVGDVKIAAVEAFTEENEQLNKMAVSSVEGDPNVAGVLVTIDDDNDLDVAMTGDFIIRIAQGTTVARGDLLMSAGDGTAKPQGDDIVRSKTIAKVTSTTVSTTYSDGSYCVPCVLMAC